MEDIFAPSSSPRNKQMKKASRKNNVPRSSLIPSRLTENLPPATTFHGRGGGALFAPPPPTNNYPPPPLYFSYPNSLPQQPPLLPLPLPISKARFYSLPSNNIISTPSRGSPTATSKKTNRSLTRDQSLTPKKSFKRPTTTSQEPKADTKVVVPSTTLPVGLDPNDLPKDVSMASCSFTSVGVGDKIKFEGLISSSEMVISPPPPSSLPLPKFSMRPKKPNMISCTAEAASVDDGATDNLRRVLRLR